MQYDGAYRLAMPALERLVANIFHTGNSALIYAAFDLLAGFPALYLLYRLTVDLPPTVPDRPKDRALKILLFLAILQFPMAWVIPLQRPETLPSTLFLAIGLCCLAKIEANALWSLPILLATFLQIFLRAEVALVFGIAIALVGLWTIFRQNARTGRSFVILGSLIALISGGVQKYLSSLHPGISLDNQMRANLTFHNLQVALLALLPFLLFFIFLIVKRPFLNIIEKTVVVSALLYLPLYYALGVLSEVRIYVPFMLILTMVVARVSASFLSQRLDAAA
jgi:hypothetical protein